LLSRVQKSLARNRHSKLMVPFLLWFSFVFGEKKGDEVFLVAALLTGNGRWDDIRCGKPERVCALENGFLGKMMITGIDKTLFPHKLLPNFELRLNQADDCCRLEEDGYKGGENFCQRDKGDINGGKIRARIKLFGFEVTGIGVFPADDSRVCSEFPIQLVGTAVNGVNETGSSFEEDLGKSSRGSTDVNGDFVFGREVETIQSMDEFEGSSTHIGKLFSYTENIGGLYGITCLGNGGIIH